ncbi:tetraacyldisaccharide 4'-kinase [Limnohabitans sp. T6-5]|uniref:tetraacyldisaccharide 4'-kinase n=1 Tax=Limnohabitans sp. T6-5 TaxID=1100724 RepID=UPI000D3C35D4|nr:tetraacyldisaccharide 4'-kinase [Limnohabitans sp. T6-5]PUE07061.1 tetraacyldisaccharide 4'-kinase [Limnohabitans sp. T6-5]
MSLRAYLHQHLPQVWSGRGMVARLLLPVAWLYGALMLLRRWAYRAGYFKSERVPALVIVVGNVVAGGAGKTPTTIALVQHLMSQGLRVGVISRGHGRVTRDTRPVERDSQPQDVGDEPLLIHQTTGAPLWVAALRADAARALLQAHPEVQILVCDDGLQHLALARDIEICVMDERGVGNGWLLPAGPLRETWPRQVDLLLHTGPSAVGGGYQARRQLAPHARASDGQLVLLGDLQAQAVDAVAGLARPQAFFDMLRQSGMRVAQTTALPDHHDYAQWPTSTSHSTSQRPLLCTEKDAAKLWQHDPHALAVPLQLTPEDGFWRALDALIAQKMPVNVSASR